MEQQKNNKKNITALFMAWGNFTVIPCPYKHWDSSLNHRMLMYLPAIGAVIGFVWVLCLSVLSWIGIPAALLAVCAEFLIFRLCGYMHLDGFMDVSDAVMSRRPLEERQRILKDSRVGAFAVICLVFLLLVWFAAAESLFSSLPSFLSSTSSSFLSSTSASSASDFSAARRGAGFSSMMDARGWTGGLSAMIGAGICGRLGLGTPHGAAMGYAAYRAAAALLLPVLLFLVPVFSRACAGRMVLTYEPIRTSQYVEGNADPEKKSYRIGIYVLTAALMAAVCAVSALAAGVQLDISASSGVGLWLCQIASAAGLLAVMWIAGWLACRHARKQLGGMNGDIAGYTICISELAGIVLLALACM